jgi:hypothetical protein
MIVEILLIAVGVYLLCGLVFAIPFVLVGAGKIDPTPPTEAGVSGYHPWHDVLWPVLARRWLKGIHEPPEEYNPHRRAARTAVPM